jgi:hypothetical protein
MVGRRQLSTPVCQVQENPLVAMVDSIPGRNTPPDASARRGRQPTPTRVHGEQPVQLSGRIANMRAAYMRASLCLPVSCCYA